MIRPRAGTALDRSMLQGVAVFRWVAWAWATIGVIISRDHLTHAVWAGLMLGAAFVVTAGATVLARTRPRLLLSPTVVAAEVALGTVMLVADGWVFASGREQSLPWAWPAAGVITVAIAYGARVGMLAAGGLAVASFIGESQLHGVAEWSVAASSKTALYVLAALVAGTVARRLRAAEHEISTARARAEMARELHDGVLQTLAVVQRRSTDDELASLARDQERDLRNYLFGTKVESQSLPAALRDAATRIARRYGVQPEVVVADDLPALDPPVSEALTGAVAEALTNAAKHSGGDRVVVYVEPDDEGGVFCSVNDNGSGFDPATVADGEGLRRSIRARVAEQGGRVEIHSRPERGTEVRLWLGSRGAS